MFVNKNNVDNIGIEKEVAATMPSAQHDPNLHGFVRGSQFDEHDHNEVKRDSKWPEHESESHWDARARVLHLLHTAVDKARCLRAYVVDIMDSTKCHQDFQMAQGFRLWMEYVCKYVSKFSDSHFDEWANDEADGNSVAERYCFRYHPLEPEMTLQLCGQMQKQWAIGTESGGMRSFLVPHVGSYTIPEEIHLYETCAWKGADTTLLDFLRKSNNKGEIIDWLRKKYEQSGKECSLEVFAEQYIMQGEKVVAARTLSRLNDKFYGTKKKIGQWLVLHAPFKKLEDLEDPVVEERVPEKYKHFATTLRRRPEFWNDDARIAEEMRLEGHVTEHIETTLNMLKAQRALIAGYIDGLYDKNEENARVEKDVFHDPGHDFAGPQLEFEKAINDRVDLALLANHSKSYAEADAARTKCLKQGKPVICSGPPGSGKTTVMGRGLQRAVELGARVLFALPTAQLAARMRERHPNIDVDTCHAAFQLHRNVKEHLAILMAYDLVAVDEFSLLSQEDFEHILQLWHAADKIPALIFLGDRYQLPGPVPSRAWESHAWKSCFHKNLYFSYRHRSDKRFGEILAAIRTKEATKALVLEMCKGRKAWHRGSPTVEDIQKLMTKQPHTKIVTFTKKGAHFINELFLEMKYGDEEPLAIVDGDFESNVDNYDHGKLIAGRKPLPADIHIHQGMKLFLTRNVRKEDDFVNGMEVVVERVDGQSQSIVAMTQTGHRLSIFPWTDREHQNVVFYPIRYGYASVIDKVQGAEFTHITIWADSKMPRPGAAYTAFSRVHSQDEYLVGGWLEASQIIPSL